MSAARQRRREQPGPATRVAAVLGGRAGREHARSGETLGVRVDRLLLAGPTAALVLAAAGWTPGAARRGKGDGPRVGSPERIAVVAGAEQPADERRALQLLARDRGFAVALEPARAGLPGVVAADDGLVGPEDVVAGTTADVGALGALGCVPLRCSTAELAALLSDPVLRTSVPATRVVRVGGRLPRWASGFDLAVAVLDALQADGAQLDHGGPAAGDEPQDGAGAALQLCGPTIDALDLPERLSLCGTLAAAGRLALIAPDLRTRTWLAARRSLRREAGPAVHEEGTGGPTPEADTHGALELDASTARTVALQGGFVGPRPTLEDAGQGLRIDEAWLGGRIEELRQAAEVLRDRSVRRGLLLAVVAASQRTLLHAIEEGLAADMLRAGATLLPPGAHPPPLAAGACRVTSMPGRPDEVLAGAAVVAASAVAGRVVEPETMRRAHRRATRVH
jgi:3-isopropylmalate/(R)-2-methylmalate dehydratase large subunit